MHFHVCLHLPGDASKRVSSNLKDKKKTEQINILKIDRNSAKVQQNAFRLIGIFKDIHNFLPVILQIEVCSHKCDKAILLENFLNLIKIRPDESYEELVQGLLSTDGVQLEEKLGNSSYVPTRKDQLLNRHAHSFSMFNVHAPNVSLFLKSLEKSFLIGRVQTIAEASENTKLSTVSVTFFSKIEQTLWIPVTTLRAPSSFQTSKFSSKSTI